MKRGAPPPPSRRRPLSPRPAGLSFLLAVGTLVVVVASALSLSHPGGAEPTPTPGPAADPTATTAPATPTPVPPTPTPPGYGEARILAVGDVLLHEDVYKGARQADGTYGLTSDLWGGHVEAETGPGYGRLLQLYGVHKATIEARRKGLSVVRRPQQNGGIKLVIMGV